MVEDGEGGGKAAGSTGGPLSITAIASDLESYLNRQAAYVQFISSNVESKLHIPGHVYCTRSTRCCGGVRNRGVIVGWVQGDKDWVGGRRIQLNTNAGYIQDESGFNGPFECYGGLF